MHALTRSASLTDYEQVARSVGLDPFHMLRMAKLPAKALDDPNVLISADSVGWLLEESARLSGQEAFGLLLAETRSLGNLGMLALLIREEPTLRAAVQSLVRYMRLQNAGVQLRLDDPGDIVMLHVGYMQGHGVSRQAIEQSTGIGLRTLRVLSRNTFRPVRICFTHERACQSCSAPPRPGYGYRVFTGMQCHRVPRARSGNAHSCCRPSAESRSEAMAGLATGRPPRRADAARAPDSPDAAAKRTLFGRPGCEASWHASPHSSSPTGGRGRERNSDHECGTCRTRGGVSGQQQAQVVRSRRSSRLFHCRSLFALVPQPVWQDPLGVGHPLSGEQGGEDSQLA